MTASFSKPMWGEVRKRIWTFSPPVMKKAFIGPR